jgi:hypothetical protein
MACFGGNDDEASNRRVNFASELNVYREFCHIGHVGTAGLAVRLGPKDFKYLN